MPHPELHKLDKLVGIWEVSGDVKGQVNFSWMEGGFFLVQFIDVEGTKGLEFIGFDEEAQTFRSHYFDGAGKVLQYTYQITDTDHIVTIDNPAVRGGFDGKYDNNGNTIAGCWHWIQNGEEFSYNTTLRRVPLS